MLTVCICRFAKTPGHSAVIEGQDVFEWGELKLEVLRRKESYDTLAVMKYE